MGVREGVPDAEPDLRAYLNGEAQDFVQTYITIALAAGDTELATYMRKSWQGRLDALLEGRAVQLHRYDLPDWHDQSPVNGGDPGDMFELGPDDVLRGPIESAVPQFKPNRAQRRAAGFRGPWRSNGDGPVG